MEPSSGACLYHYLYQMMVVRDVLGMRVGGCLGAVSMANSMPGAVGLVVSLLVPLFSFVLVL